MLSIARHIRWLIKAQLGINAGQLIRSIRGIPRYVRDYFRFRKGYRGRLEWRPCLHDWYEEGGSTRSEYFWQDLIVARMIFRANPRRHVDVGSRIDGFVAHVASFREIDVIDVRPVTARVPGIVFRQMDLARGTPSDAIYDSASCLHALEHFGLGRYGDDVDPMGYATGLANLAGLLAPQGKLYLSVPVGRARVEFNAHRVFDPRELVDLASQNALQLISLSAVSSGGELEVFEPAETAFAELARREYTLAILVFQKGG